MQMEALECGAASLTMILAYYNKWIPLEQVRLDCGVSRDGSNANNIIRAARSYGFTAKGYRFESGGKPKSMVGYAKKRLAGAGAAVAFVVLTSLISSLMGIINPVFSRIFLDRLLTGKKPDWFMPFILALGGMGII